MNSRKRKILNVDPFEESSSTDVSMHSSRGEKKDDQEIGVTTSFSTVSEAGGGGTTDENDENFKFVLMEWDKGSLYWGIKRGTPSDITVQNCTKPCGKIVNRMLDYETVFKNTDQSKLSCLDIQTNPDMDFLIMEVGRAEFLSVERCNNKPSIIGVKPGCHDQFIQKLSSSFSAYISE